jgi:hypothetical protein
MGGPGGSPDVNLHVFGITKDGKLWHTSRPKETDGSVSLWNPWEEVKAKRQNEPGPFVSVDSVNTWNNNGQEVLHVLGITQDGTLWYTSRVEKQDWQPFENLSTQIGGNEGKLLQVGATVGISGNPLDAFVIAQTKQGEQRILHTSSTDGTTWEKFEDITQPELAGFPGSFISVDCAHISAGTSFDLLQVCGITKDGNLWHTLNFATPVSNLRWLPFANVALLSHNVPTPLANISLAQGSNTLNVCALSKGNLWHTSRISDDPPAWQPTFDNISEEAADKPEPFGSVSCADVNGTLHACGITQDGKIWHTSRTSINPPTWQAFEDITAVIGSSGHFIIACVANSTLAIHTLTPHSGGGTPPSCSRIALEIKNDQLQKQGVAAQASRVALQQDINALKALGKQELCPGF